MSGLPVCRLSDMGTGICPNHTPVPLPYTVLFLVGDPFVTADGLPVIRVGDIGVASCGHSTVALIGSAVVDSSALAVHRMTDMGQNFGPYVALTGSPTVDAL
jgi:hypothetical protein